MHKENTKEGCLYFKKKICIYFLCNNVNALVSNTKKLTPHNIESQADVQSKD